MSTISETSKADHERAIAVPAASTDAMVALGGIIIILVLVGSYTTRYQMAIGHSVNMAWFPAVGFVALQLFLARSAYRLIDEVKGFSSLGAYIKGRALRYLPAVIPSVLLAYMIGKTVALPGFHAELKSLPANLLMLADMIGVPDVDGAHYRLKIELLLSVFVGLVWFSPLRRHMAPVLLSALILATLFFHGEPVRETSCSVPGLLTVDGYMPLFIFGFALNHLIRDRAEKTWFLIAAFSAGLVFLSNTPMHGLVVLAALAGLTGIVTGRLNGLGRLRSLVWLGELAFPIYVVHLTLGFAVMSKLEALGVNPVHAMLVAAAFAIATGKTINILFERRAEAYVAFMSNVLVKGVGRKLAVVR